MKRLVLMIVMFASFATMMMGQDVTPENYYIGKWKLLVEGLPSGDTEMLLVISKKADGKYEGTLGDLDGSNATKLTKVVIEDGELSVNYFADGYDIPVYFEKSGDDGLTGSMNDMFDITGKRIIVEKK